MSDYYSLLGVERTADQNALKRAYYTKVRLYPPEKFPEEFKKLRLAYETLNDAKKRAEYDITGTLPSDAAFMYNQAQMKNSQGRHKEAAEVLKKIVSFYPELAFIKANLARTLEHDEKFGTAIKIWEELHKTYPDNAEYVEELALSCAHRGWNKKAETYFTRLLKLDNTSEVALTNLIDFRLNDHDYDAAQELVKQSLEAFREKGAESYRLLYYAVLFSLNNTSEAKKHLEEIALIVRPKSGEWLADNRGGLEEIIFSLLNAAMIARQHELIKPVKEIASLCPNLSEGTHSLLDYTSLIIEIEGLNDKGFSVVFHDMLVILAAGEDEEDEESMHEIMAMEYYILSNMQALRSQLIRLKTEYPRLYELHRGFFEEALRTPNLTKLINKRQATLLRLGSIPAFDFEDEETQMPVRRETPKIGRNDPCPCGSGKKYKKCCGA